MEPVPPVTGVSDLTPQWCTAALAAHDGRRRRSPTSASSSSAPARSPTRPASHLTYEPAGAGPATARRQGSGRRRDQPAARRASTRTYEIEAGFYRDLAATLPVRTPRCHHAAHDPETDAYVVLLEDVAPAVQGDQMAGCSVDEIAAADRRAGPAPRPPLGRRVAGVDRVAVPRRHRPSGSSPSCSTPPARSSEHYAERLDADTNAVVDRLVPRLGDYLAGAPAAVDDRPRRLPRRQPAVRRRSGRGRRLADGRARPRHGRPQLPARRQPRPGGAAPARAGARRPLRRRAARTGRRRRS